MEELRNLDSEHKQLVQTFNITVDECYELIRRHRPDIPFEILNLTCCRQGRCATSLELFSTSLHRKILEHEIKLKELQKNKKAYHNEIEMLQHYANFQNHVTNENTLVKRNAVKKVTEATIDLLDPAKVELLKVLTDHIKFQ